MFEGDPANAPVDDGEPALLLGEARVLDRHDDVERDPAVDFSVALFEPVRLTLGEDEHPFHSFAEDQGHRHDRADSALEREPVTSPAWIELGPGLEDDDELAGDYPRAK